VQPHWGFLGKVFSSGTAEENKTTPTKKDKTKSKKNPMAIWRELHSDL